MAICRCGYDDVESPKKGHFHPCHHCINLKKVDPSHMINPGERFFVSTGWAHVAGTTMKLGAYETYGCSACRSYYDDYLKTLERKRA